MEAKLPVPAGVQLQSVGLKLVRSRGLRVSGDLGPGDQPSRIQQVERSVGPLRPPRTRLKLHAEEVADLAVYTVPNPALQLTLGVVNPEVGFQRDRCIQLEAGTRKRYIFQVGNGPPGPATLVLPPDVDQVGTKHPGFHPLILHTFNYRPHTERGLAISHQRFSLITQ